MNRKRGLVLEVLSTSPELQELLVEVDGEKQRAYNYPLFAGPVEVGQEVLLNTTAVELGLGTGGRHFVLPTSPGGKLGAGHIMKLRYTPIQFNALSVEEEDSPYHSQLAAFETLAGMPVVVATLHSLLPTITAALRFKPSGQRREILIAYLMIDGAALPLALSRLVPQLKKTGLIDFTITCGQAFGGDYEAVNLYSGLAAAKVLGADVAVVAMGPGIVGTGTKWGTTAVQQGEAVNTVSVLGGRAVAVPRLSFADPRPRHRGVSHHTLTALGRVALAPAIVALPQLSENQLSLVKRQLVQGKVAQRHLLEIADASYVLPILKDLGIPLSTMGRGAEEERAFFLAGAAGGAVASSLLA
ncbi:MAG: DUF3866 family protein [Firmicutes bacterium]|jgi:hypothetical protein|nr:DUF3866 family protein [Bacillota bacterium]HQD40694.1 DUF3866 family protein [Bacillota bacterium]